MSVPTTSLAFTSSTPAAPSGDQDVVFQSDGGGPLQKFSAYPRKATASLRGVVKPDGTTITVDGSGVISAVGSPGSIPYVTSAGSVNAMTATFSPAVTSLTAGLEIDILPNLANTTTTPTLNVDGLGAKTITKNGTAALVAGDYTTTAIAKLIYDGTGWQLQNPQTGSGGASSIPYAVATGSVNAMVATFTPPITTLAAGQAVIVLANLANTSGAPTLDVGTGAKTIWKFATGSGTFGSNGLQPGDYNALAPGVYIYDGTQWQLQNPQAQMLLGAGSAGAPAYSFASASDYGMWVGSGAIRFSRSGSDIFDIGIGGVNVNGDMAASTVHAGNGFTGSVTISGHVFTVVSGIITNIT